MKVKIGPYTNWFGPYQLAETLCFWAKKEKDEYGYERTPDWVHNFGEWLAHGSVEPEEKVGDITSWDRDRPTTLLYKFLQWIESKKERTIKVHIDRWDTWSMDHTLAHIILPMLKQLKERKHGSQMVDMEDVPEHMRTTSTEEYDQQLTFDFYHEDTEKRQYDIHDRWDWVMDEMIFAFENKLDDSWQDQFESGESDLQWKKLEDGMSQMIHGPNHTRVYDWAGRQKYQERISNGFRLFGKYYEGLWD